MPGEGLIVHQHQVPAIDDTLAMGCWSATASFGIGADCGADWCGQLLEADGSSFSLQRGEELAVQLKWSYCGRHNVENALVAVAAAHHVGVMPEVAVAALAEFSGVKRRLELIGSVADIAVYDDFAHHPTAIATTLQGLRARAGEGRVIALVEPRSNTMRMGQHREQLAQATREADQVFWFQPPAMDWSLDSVIADSPVPATLVTDLDELVSAVVAQGRPGDQIVIMSNGSFGGVHQKLLARLQAENASD